MSNFMGDKLILNFGTKFQHYFSIAHVKLQCTKLPCQCSAHVSAKMEAKFQNVVNEDVRALKDMLENLNTQKGTSRRILPGILLKDSENFFAKSQ